MTRTKTRTKSVHLKINAAQAQKLGLRVLCTPELEPPSVANLFRLLEGFPQQFRGRRSDLVLKGESASRADVSRTVDPLSFFRQFDRSEPTYGCDLYFTPEEFNLLTERMSACAELRGLDGDYLTPANYVRVRLGIGELKRPRERTDRKGLEQPPRPKRRRGRPKIVES